MTGFTGPDAPDWPVCSLGMTNYDHTIDSGLADELRTHPVVAHHAAWEFSGTVWSAGGRFHEAVRRYHVHVDTLSADSLEDLMRVVNDRWGWE